MTENEAPACLYYKQTEKRLFQGIEPSNLSPSKKISLQDITHKETEKRFFQINKPSNLSIKETETETETQRRLLDRKLIRLQHIAKFWGELPEPYYRFQLFSMRVDYNNEKPGKLYGYVEIDGCGTGNVSVFDCGPDFSKPIDNNGLVPLSDPTSVPSANTVSITSQLFVIIDGVDKDFDEDEEEGFEVSNMGMHWDMSRHALRNFDFCSAAISEGKYGHVTIYYIVMNRAVEATMEVSFTAPYDDVDGNGRHFDGKIVAYYGNFVYDCSPDEREYYKITLFEADPNVSLKTGKLPLLRSVMAVPYNCSLKIDARFWDDESGEDYIYDFHCFLTLPKDSSTYRIKGKNGCHLDLKVHWKYEPLPDDCS